MPAKKTRLDQLLLDRGLVSNRSRAQALIVAGKVFSGERRLDKPGHQVTLDLDVVVRAPDYPWVSRGGVKLSHALDHFHLNPAGRVCLDIGASTGGFTHVLLDRGADRVYAVDVGYGQLADPIRNNNKVTILDRTNARYLDGKTIPQPIDFLVCDASFIGLRTVLPASLLLTANSAIFIGLIKPQFEVGKQEVGKGGIVRDVELHTKVIAQITDWLSAQAGWDVLGVTPSPITGVSGNQEYLIAAKFRS